MAWTSDAERAKQMAQLNVAKTLFGSKYSLMGRFLSGMFEPSPTPFRAPPEDNAFHLTGTPKKDYQIAAASLASGAMMPFGTPVMNQIKAYHGSPHKFDKFKMSKVGTGEGAQSFGHGLYFTSKASIAKGYADRLTKPILIINNEHITPTTEAEKVAWSVLNTYKTPEKAKAELLKDARWKTGKEAYQLIAAGAEIATPNIYKASLHSGKTPDQYDYLRWDKPISKEQAKKYATAYAKAHPRADAVKVANNLFRANRTGQEIYESISGQQGSDKAASEFLLRAGIDGIKYPSGTLSGVKDSKDFNYVVFDEESISMGHPGENESTN